MMLQMAMLLHMRMLMFIIIVTDVFDIAADAALLPPLRYFRCFAFEVYYFSRRCRFFLFIFLHFSPLRCFLFRRFAFFFTPLSICAAALLCHFAAFLLLLSFICCHYLLFSIFL